DRAMAVTTSVKGGRETLNKAELIDAVAEKGGTPKAETAKVVSAALEVIQAALARGERVALPGLGVLAVRDRAARTGRDPRTGETLLVPARRVVVFRPASGLKEAVR
ncbi:MAG: HU family DNA-binding protein, partial [Desulfotomaculales bacterium]